MNNKTYFIIIAIMIIVAFLLGILSYYFLIAEDNIVATEKQTELPFSVIDREKLENPDLKIETEEGFLTVRNFLQDPATVPDSSNVGQYSLGYYVDPSIDELPQVPYVIDYIESSNFFNIALFQEPIGQTRKDAEFFLMRDLDITEAEMCDLKYMVSVPNRVNPVLAGVNLGFSFCPGSVVLE